MTEGGEQKQEIFLNCKTYLEEFGSCATEGSALEINKTYSFAVAEVSDFLDLHFGGDVTYTIFYKGMEIVSQNI